MGLSFLEPDNPKRNLSVFIIALLACLVFFLMNFMKNHGCSGYPDNLKSCTPFKCAQRVTGFKDTYLTHKALILRREIVGLQKDKYFDTTTCTVIETDDINEGKPVTCKYSDKTRETAIHRASILFGVTPVPLPLPRPDTQEKTINTDSIRASYATRTPEQAAECK